MWLLAFNDAYCHSVSCFQPHSCSFGGTEEDTISASPTIVKRENLGEWRLIDRVMKHFEADCNMHCCINFLYWPYLFVDNQSNHFSPDSLSVSGCSVEACGPVATQLKSYQLVGINFLMMLHKSESVGGAILADEMVSGRHDDDDDDDEMHS